MCSIFLAHSLVFLIIHLGSCLFLFAFSESFMDDHGQDPNNPSHGSERSEPVRTRWTPKPEQILILESIFNSGMVNPPKDETVRIRKLLEKFGSVGDANVFYWFQNRRSRSRRRQRQIQASLAVGEQQGQATSGEGAIEYSGGSPAGFVASSSSCLVGSSSSSGVAGGDDLFSFSSQMGLPGAEPNSSMASLLCPSDTSNLQYQSGNCMAGFITVFINGVPTEVTRGQIDMKAMFGPDMVLVHSSGIPIPFNEYGLSVESLQHGESYFLVPRLG